MDRRLYRSSKEKMILGVCGGIAEYINADPTIVRIIYALISIFTAGFPGIAFYLILALIMPAKD